MATFQQRVDEFHREAPIRAARRANENPLRRLAGKIVGLAVLLAVVLLALLAAAAILVVLAAIAKVSR